MPIYEYFCAQCGTTEEVYRNIEARDLTPLCPVGHATKRVYSVPVVSIWDASRQFPNAVKSGPGTFPSRATYESHLKENHIAEVKTDGRMKSRVPRSMRPH